MAGPKKPGGKKPKEQKSPLKGAPKKPKVPKRRVHYDLPIELIERMDEARIKGAVRWNQYILNAIERKLRKVAAELAAENDDDE